VTTRQEVLNAIRQHDGYHHLITVPRVFIELTGDPRSALLLSQLLYWTDRASSAVGWVYKTRQEWQDELGLTRHGLYAARARLSELGLTDESHHLVNSRRTLHLRLRYEELLLALKSLRSTESAPSNTPGLPPNASVTRRTPHHGQPPPGTTAPLNHMARLFARKEARDNAVATASQRPDIERSNDRYSDVRPSEPQPSDRLTPGRPSVPPSAVRPFDLQPLEWPFLHRPRAEITPENLSEITAESSAERMEEGGREPGRPVTSYELAGRRSA
jgi:hypothetical protein